MMKKSILAISLVAGLLAAGTAIKAQEIDPGARLEQVRAFIKERAQTRPRLAPPPVGRIASRIEAPAINWDEADRLVAATSEQQAGRLSSVAAVRTGPTVGVLQASPANFPRLRAAEAARPQIPVLVPAQTRILQTAQLFGQANAYTAIAEIDDGIDLRMSGSLKRLVLERPPAARLRMVKLRSARAPLPGVGARYVITRSNSSTDLSFSRFNVGYVLSVICDDPDDERCAKDDFITSLASSMALLNNRPGADQ